MNSSPHRTDAHIGLRTSAKRWRALGAALAAAALAGLIVSASSPANPASPSPQRLAFLAKSTFQGAQDPSFPRPGDTTVATDANFQGSRKLGVTRAACVVVDAAAELQCTATVGLRGGAVAASFTQGLTSDHISVAITGGTGRYAGAHGTATLTRVGSTANFHVVAFLSTEPR